MGHYSGRLAIIAGGLGGLGTSISHRLLQNGASVALLYAPFESSRREQTLKSAYGSTTPDRVQTFECDITSESSVASAFEQINNSLTTASSSSSSSSTQQSNETTGLFPSILVNAAGYVTVQPIEDTSAEETLRNLIPNVVGPLITSKAFFNLYRTYSSTSTSSTRNQVPPGRIISISSQAAHVALPGHAAYCASKSALNSLTRCMANEWAQYGITSNTVSPTVVLTELGKRAWSDEKKRQNMLDQIPTGRFAVPEEVAAAVEGLCRDDMGMVNGADLRVDGGFSIR